MRDWLIKKLGGVTQEKHDDLIKRSVRLALQKEASISDVVRSGLKGVSFSDTYFKDMDEAARKEFVGQIAQVSQNKAFMRLLHELKNIQIIKTFTEATDTDQLKYGQMKVDGILVVEDEIKKLAGIHLDNSTNEEKVDPTQVI